MPAPVRPPAIAGPAPPKSNRKRTALAIAAIAVILVIVVAAVFAAIGGRQHSTGNNNVDNIDDESVHIPAPDIRFVSWTYSQNVLNGDTTVNVKVTNMGDAIGSKTINVKVTLGQATYSNDRYFILAPGETQTYSIVVDTPFGKEVNTNNISIKLTGS